MELALAFLVPPNVLTFITCPVLPSFHSVAVLLVVRPLTIVDGAVKVQIFPLSTGFVVSPLSHIYIAIGVDKPTKPMRLSIEELSFVERTIEPDEFAFSHAHL